VSCRTQRAGGAPNSVVAECATVMSDPPMTRLFFGDRDFGNWRGTAGVFYAGRC
jgi:hypothetical protein